LIWADGWDDFAKNRRLALLKLRQRLDESGDLILSHQPNTLDDDLPVFVGEDISKSGQVLPRNLGMRGPKRLGNPFRRLARETPDPDPQAA
jgi:hypothetical protein